MSNSIYLNQIQNSSLIDDYYSDEETINSNTEFPLSVLDEGYLLSIELKREKAKKELEHSFHFTTINKEVDFISSDQDLHNLLPSIGEFFLKEVSNNSKLTLELMEEENNWRTLFINVPIDRQSDWKSINKIVDSFYDTMFDTYPSVMEKLNIDLVSYEF